MIYRDPDHQHYFNEIITLNWKPLSHTLKCKCGHPEDEHDEEACANEGCECEGFKGEDYEID